MQFIIRCKKKLPSFDFHNYLNFKFECKIFDFKNNWCFETNSYIIMKTVDWSIYCIVKKLFEKHIVQKINYVSQKRKQKAFKD